VGVFLPMTAVVFYLAASLLYLVEPFRHMRTAIRHAAPPG